MGVVDKLLRREPDNGVALHLRGVLHQEAGAPTAATACFRRGVSSSGGRPRTSLLAPAPSPAVCASWPPPPGPPLKPGPMTV